ncbi:hypothetical protein WMY93_013307 [Mugilogobius chulae]|uniref:RRM domain-containing protein n=1 Tax=Mugilogobius chulae TaxID=88201 RepID=A0AAW0PBZ8_9GOBI
MSHYYPSTKFPFLLVERRNLDSSGVKSILLARLKEVIENEGGDPDNIEIQSADTPTRKAGKAKGKKVDSDADVTNEDDMSFKELEECESEKDVTDTDDGTRDNSKPAPSEDSLTQPEAEVHGETRPESMGDSEAEAEHEPDPEEDPMVMTEDDDHMTEGDVPELHPEPEEETMPELEIDPEVELRTDLEPEPELDLEADADDPDETDQVEMEADTLLSSKEVEDDHLSVSMQNEDAITLDVDDAEKSADEPGPSTEMGPDDDDEDDDAKEDKSHRDGKKDDVSKGEAMKKAETGDKEKDSGKKGPASTGAGQAKSTSRDGDGKGSKDEKGLVSNSSFSGNLWVSGLSSNTKAADLKNLFGKYGKVLSAKVVTNARSPGSKCYGLVTMSSSTEVARCISHLDRTELDGQQIYVERAKNDPFKKDPAKKEGEDKNSSSKSNEKRSSTGAKAANKSQASYKKEDKKSDKDKDSSKEREIKSGKSSDGTTSNSGQEFSKKDDRKHSKGRSPGKLAGIGHNKGDFNYHKMKSFRQGRYSDKPFNNIQRWPKWLVPPEELELMKNKQTDYSDRGRDQEIVPFEKMKEQRMRERMERAHRAEELRRRRQMAEQARRERERERERERQERENLLRERERLEMERQKLERERLERERLERERIRIEQASLIGREVEHGRRDDQYWNGNKKIQSEDVRLNQASNCNRQQNRFNNFNPRERGRFPEASEQHSFERRNRFDGDKDRRNRDDRRPVPMHDRPMGPRAPIPGMSHNRSPRDGVHGWKNDGGINTNKGELRGTVRMRDDRPGRDGPGPVVRGGSSGNHGRNFNDRDGRPMVMNEQPFSLAVRLLWSVRTETRD